MKIVFFLIEKVDQHTNIGLLVINRRGRSSLIYILLLNRLFIDS